MSVKVGSNMICVRQVVADADHKGGKGKQKGWHDMHLWPPSAIKIRVVWVWHHVVWKISTNILGNLLPSSSGYHLIVYLFIFINRKHVRRVKLCASSVLITGLPSTLSQAKWLTKTLRPGSRVGADPDLVKYSIWKPLQTDLEAGGLFLVPVTTNLIDLIWEDRPPVPCNVIQPLPVKYTGRREWFTSLCQLLHPYSVVNDVEVFQMSITKDHC